MNTFDKSAHFLQSLRQPSFVKSCQAMYRVCALSQIFQVYHNLNPNRCQEALAHSAPITISLLEGQITPFEARALSQVNELFPLDMDYLEMTLMEVDEPLAIHILPQGFPWTYDELSEIILDPSTCGKAQSLEIFIVYLSLLIVRDDAWTEAAHYFGWPNSDPPETPEKSRLDIDQFFDNLTTHGLDYFQAAFQVVWAETGNFFLDYNPYEDGYVCEPLPFNFENVLYLTELWEQARPFILDYHKACEHVASKPGVLSQIADLFQASLVNKEEWSFSKKGDTSDE